MTTRKIAGALAVVSLIAQGLIVGAVPAVAQQSAITGDGYAGDFNGDGKQDIASFNKANGAWLVGLSTGTRFNFTHWADYASVNGWTHVVGDYNGDGKDDIFGYRNDRFVVAVSDGTKFTVSTWRELNLSWTWQTFIAGDYNADGLDDIAGYHKEAEKWQVYISSGSSFPTSVAWTAAQSVANWSHVGGDYNGDGKYDIASFNPGNNNWRVHLSTGSAFTTSTWATVTPDCCWGRKRSGDFNADGRDDIASFLNGSEWRVSKSRTDNTFTTARWAALSPTTGWTEALVADYDLDGRDDIANFQSATSTWYVSLTSGATSFSTSIWGDLQGTNWTQHLGGDFTGDGKPDVASYHPEQATWWVGQNNGSSFTMSNWNPANSPPYADFTFQCQDLTCQFTDTSTDRDGTITTWGWNFGDGTNSPDQNPTHTYQSAGIYNVTLTIVDDQGASHQTSKNVAVNANDTAPVAGFSYSCKLLTCTFTSKSTDADGQITIYRWDFGDGTSSREKNPTHRYSKGDSYTVEHSVTDDGSNSDTASRIILVVQPHKRSVGLLIDHYVADRVYLRARGKIRVPDGFKACKANRPVIIQRKRGTRWVKVARAVTRQDGRYRIYPFFGNPPTDRPGVYRALARKERPANQPGHACLKAVSRTRRHTH
ncbi:MAG TPA: PKD domain-containing protein [Actinomycetota bacterium]|nr:PKD domain-containing protein [Actinomycetota bacterium]